MNNDYQNYIVPIPQENYLGKMDIECIYCNAKHFSGEKVSN